MWHPVARRLVLLAGLTLAVAACAPTASPQQGAAAQQQPPAAEKTLLIGAALPITGALAPEGKFQKDGYDLWKETINAKGGIKVGNDTYKVDIVYLDYKSDTSTAVRLAEKLITEDKVQFLFAPFGSGATAAVSAVNEKYEIPMLAPTTATEEVYEKGNRYLFGLLVGNRVFAQGAVDLLLQPDPKPRTMAIIARNDLFPTAVAKAVDAEARARGLEIVYFEQYAIDSTDLSSPLLAAKAKTPDVIFGTGFVNDLILMTKQAKEQRVNPRAFLQTAGPEQPAFIENLKADANYVITATWWAPEATYTDQGLLFGSAADYARRFQDRYGYRASYTSAASSACGFVLQTAIEKAGSVDPKQVRDAIASLEVQSFFGPIKFNQGGQNIGPGIAILQVQDQKLVAIAPREAATGEFVYPMPEWEKR